MRSWPTSPAGSRHAPRWPADNDSDYRGQRRMCTRFSDTWSRDWEWLQRSLGEYSQCFRKHYLRRNDSWQGGLSPNGAARELHTARRLPFLVSTVEGRVLTQYHRVSTHYLLHFIYCYLVIFKYSFHVSPSKVSRTILSF